MFLLMTVVLKLISVSRLVIFGIGSQLNPGIIRHKGKRKDMVKISLPHNHNNNINSNNNNNNKGHRRISNNNNNSNSVSIQRQ